MRNREKNPAGEIKMKGPLYEKRASYFEKIFSTHFMGLRRIQQPVVLVFFP
jgi:hypothetical protein